MAFPAYTTLRFNGYAHQPQAGTERTEMDSGPPKQRVRFDRILHQVPVVYRFTDAQYTSFLTWWETTIKRVDWFADWVHPRTGTTMPQARIVGGEIEPSPVYREGELPEWDVAMVMEYWGS